MTPPVEDSAEIEPLAEELFRAAARAARALGAGAPPDRLVIHLDDGAMFTVSRADAGGGFAVALQSAPPPAGAAEASDVPSLARVLLAEDDPVNQKVGLAMLKRLGCTAALAGDGREAVDAASRGEFDVVFLDLQMPNLGGLDACREIRALPLRAQPRIVAMTADPSAEHHAACSDAGADELIEKPLELETLRRVLSRAAAPSLDVEVFQRLRQLHRPGRDVAGDLTGSFLSGLPARLSELSADLASGATDELARRAHSLRSAAATFGAARMSALARRLEAEALEGEPPDGERILAELRKEAALFHGLAVEALGRSGAGGGA